MATQRIRWQAWAVVRKDGKKLGIRDIFKGGYAIYRYEESAKVDCASYQRIARVEIREIKP